MRIKRFDESVSDIDFQNKVENTESWRKMASKMSSLISEYKKDLENEIGCEEGDTDEYRSIGNSIQSAIDAFL